MKTKFRIVAFALMFAAFAGLSARANANVIYALNVDSSFAGGTFGTVTLDNTTTAGSILVDVLLASGYTFSVTGSKNPFAYSLSTTAAATNMVFTDTSPVSTKAGILVATSGTQTQVPFGEFTDAITMVDNGTTIYNKLDFKLAGTTLQDFIASTETNNGQLGGYLFSADVSFRGNTFTVANNPTIPATGHVPEPATVALLGLGFLGFAVSRRRQHSS
jgi:hypothetical protein